jgi:adenylate cyclase
VNADPARTRKKEPAAPEPGRGIGRLQDRIVVFFVVLLMGVQLASFYLIRFAIERTAQETLRSELRVGAKVFRRLLDQNSEKLVEATSVLTYDFGFREAIASRDQSTILSALSNHAARIRASGMAVIGLDGIVVSDTLAPAGTARPYPFPDLVNEAAARGRASSIRMIGGVTYQIVVVPVQAPLPIAWVSMSFVIDDRTARDLQSLTSLDVTFLDLATDSPRILATTLPPLMRAALLKQARALAEGAREGATIDFNGEPYEVLSMRIGDPGAVPIAAVLQRSLEDGLRPYRLLEVVLLFLAALAIAVTLIGAIRIARRITQPIANLAAAAREVERGNYDVDVPATGSLEISELAKAFSGMTRGLIERDNMRDILGKVSSHQVADQLLKGEIELGGAEVEATVMFTDVRNFTALAEKLTPTQSLQLLNEFLTEISKIIELHGGVVDKYIGDGVMGVFGAPVRSADDTQRSVLAALAIRDGMRALGKSLASRGMPDPEVGCGMNTSRMIAGNIGSPTRLNYTVLGDGVNLASRLESLTKRYHVPIVAGSRTREQVQGVVWRELDKVRVRGRVNAERIFEPLAMEGTMSPYDLDKLDAWHIALENFRQRRWDVARASFEVLCTHRGYERLCDVYQGYIREFAQRAPNADWDGAFTLYEK